jgi:hypothetical protein
MENSNGRVKLKKIEMKDRYTKLTFFKIEGYDCKSDERLGVW